LSLFSDFFGGGYQDAAQAQIAGLQQGYKQASDNYTQDRLKSSTAGANAYGDATGANVRPVDRATANFRADPGYQFHGASPAAS
jgi:hypothetical protein